MKQKDKKLLLRDLSARLSYGVFVKDKNKSTPIKCDLGCHPDLDDLEKIKIYLRPMSSMTEEEIIELSKIDEKRLIFSARHLTYCLDGEVIDYLNRKMFDYRGLIEKGLALEAPKGMYD